MAKYKVDIYYSGFVTVKVEAESEDQAHELATEEAARYHNKREGDFNEEIAPTLERCIPEADTVRKIE